MKKIKVFSAPWCHQCTQLHKMLDKTSLPIEYVNVEEDENETLTEKYNIRSLPTTIIFGSDDTEFTRFNGAVAVKLIEEAFNSCE